MSFGRTAIEALALFLAATALVAGVVVLAGVTERPTSGFVRNYLGSLLLGSAVLAFLAAWVARQSIRLGLNCLVATAAGLALGPTFIAPAVAVVIAGAIVLKARRLERGELDPWDQPRR